MVAFVFGLVRIALFWAIPLLIVIGAPHVAPSVDPSIVYDTLAKAFGGEIELISSRQFAFALAGILFAFGLGLAAAYLLVHVVWIVFTLWLARRAVMKAQGKGPNAAAARANFAAGFEGLRSRLASDWLIGHAWTEFEETLFDTDSDRAVGNTVRPQAFFNLDLAREKFSGLKMMAAVPGYFVGIGLLLTFVGLVFALYKAGQAANSVDAKTMAKAMGDLLQIATFKFSTSIAGLGASIILSVVFRFYSIVLEGAFTRFNRSLERGLLYAAPQAISVEIQRTLQDQLVQLKDITQGDFFARMGSEMAPRLNSAIADAMAPVTAQIGTAVGSLAARSQDGVQELMRSFTDQLQHGAGTEMRELAGTLKQLQASIGEMQGGLRGSGDDFAAKLSDAADNLNRMVERAGQSFETSSTQSRDALAAVVETLRQTLEKANAEIDAGLGAAAGGASAKLEAAMGSVMEKLDRQIGDVGRAVDAMQRSMAEQGDQARRDIQASVSQSADMQISALAAMENAATKAADAVRAATENALASVGKRFDELSTSMRAIEGALSSQKLAFEATSVEARKTAEAFGETAVTVRSAAAPLQTVGQTFAGATQGLVAGVDATRVALTEAKDAIAALAGGLTETNDRSGAFWTSFLAKFENVDTALGTAVRTLSEASIEQQQRLQSHVQEVDRALAEGVGKLAPALSDLADSAESIADSLKAAKRLVPAE